MKRMPYQGNLLSKTLIIGIIFFFIINNTVSFGGIILEKICVNNEYSPHDPIYINGNYDFTSENGVTGGSGWINDPYIIEGWEINASSQHGIIIKDVNVCFIIRECYIHDGGINNDGIVFKSVMHGVISYNIVNKNRNGILFMEPANHLNKIHHNNIKNNIKDGIHFYHDPWDHHSDNIIYLNNISANNQGIYMVTSSYNKIYSNNIFLNTEAGINITVCLCGGGYNNVFYNNFIKNGDENGQAREWYMSNGNEWDNDYPLGGNFWSGYMGVDNFSGPNQNVPGSDGIGDTPYDIPCYYCYCENSTDRYPLIEPWGENLPPFAEFTWTPALPDTGETILFNASESIDYDGNINLYEWDWNNDGVFDENHASPTSTHTFEEVGYYPVTLRVWDNDNLTGSITNTIIVGNKPPFKPCNPYPPDDSSVGIDINLSWDGGDPNPKDTVTYDVFFGSDHPLRLIATVGPYPANQTRIQYNLGTLPLFKEYYWKIDAYDNHDVSNSSQIWSFKTVINPPPTDPKIDGPDRGNTGVDYSFFFVSTDIDNDTIKYYINWSDGTTTDTGLYASGKVVTLNHIWNEKGEYIIKAIAEDIWGEQSGESEHKINIPRTKPFIFEFNLIGWLFDRLPFLEVFLRAMNQLR